MSWTQGVQGADEMEPAQRAKFQGFAKPGFTLSYICWDTMEPGIVHADYQNKDGEMDSMTFKVTR